MNDIIKLSDNAVNQIKEILKNIDKKIDGLLVGVDRSGCSGYSYKIDYAKNLDHSKYEIIEKDGIKVFVDQSATMFLIGSEMDYQTDKISSRFVFKNPNEKNSCGCGESFTV